MMALLAKLIPAVSPDIRDLVISRRIATLALAKTDSPLTRASIRSLCSEPAEERLSEATS
jgi:hypothetical protein